MNFGRLLAVLLVAAITTLGCRHLLEGRRAIRACPGILVPTQEIEGNFALRQRMLIRKDGTDVRLDLALQKLGDRLLLVAFDPFGVKVFTVIQTGTETEIEALPAAVLPVAPINVLRDVHRVRLLTADGADSVERDGTRISEEWRAGELQWRRFERVAGDPAGAVVVEPLPDAPAGVLGAVRIQNEWCGYEVVLSTLSEEVLP